MAKAGLGTTVDTSSADMALSTLLKGTSDVSMSAYLETVAKNWFVTRAEGRFAEGGDSASGKWAPLSQNTVDIRTNLGFTPGTGMGEINVRTGSLREWLTQPETMTVPDGLGVSMAWPGPEPDEGTRLKLSQAAGNEKGPARPVIAYDAADLSYLLTTLSGWIQAGRS